MTFAEGVSMIAQAEWPQLVNMLSWWQWAILLAVPPAIILLYFLRLKRRPLEVPSTYLWHRSIEDLHVNTIWQRLRRNLLLFLQLLLILLAMLAVLRPGWRSPKRIAERSILVLDNSASMQATDEQPSRLEEAKRQAHELIDQMDPDDVAMLISFADADSTRVKQMFTDSPRELRRALDAIRPTDRPTSLSEALNLASGLANPGRTSQDAGDVQVADALPATMYIFSDGKFPDVSEFRLGHLEPVHMPIGSPEAKNVGILAFNARPHESDPSRMEVFARIGNFGPRDVSVSVELWDRQTSPNHPIDVDLYQVPANDTQGVVFPLSLIESGVLELRITAGDDLECDDVAWAVINPPQRSKVLVVTPGNPFLDIAFGTEAVLELADVTFAAPAFLEQEEYQRQAAAGAYDLVIFDRCQSQPMPQANTKPMPQANTLFIPPLPPAEAKAQPEEEKSETAQEERPGSTGWRRGPEVEGAIIIDTDSTHPLMQWIDLGDVQLDLPTPLEMPPGGTALIDVQWIGPDNASKVGPVFAIAPRGGFEDAVMGFVLFDQRPDQDGKPAEFIGTNWPIRESFPVFVLNLLYYLGGCQATLEGACVQPGQMVTLENPLPGKPLEVLTPGGETVKLKETRPGKLDFTATSQLGVYEVRAAGKTLQRFAVNLFHARESDIRPAHDIQIGRGTPVEAQTWGREITRRELWKWLLLLGLGVLLIEWYVYNRRVYL